MHGKSYRLRCRFNLTELSLSDSTFGQCFLKCSWGWLTKSLFQAARDIYTEFILSVSIDDPLFIFRIYSKGCDENREAKPKCKAENRCTEGGEFGSYMQTSGDCTMIGPNVSAQETTRDTWTSWQVHFSGAFIWRNTCDSLCNSLTIEDAMFSVLISLESGE